MSWLAEKPDIEAKEMLRKLQATGYADFKDGQLRTLQRRVRVWRMRIARELVYGPESSSKQDTEWRMSATQRRWYASAILRCV